MIAGGVSTLAALSLTTALTSSAHSAISGLSGMTAVTLDAYFQYGSGGTACSVVVQTSFDDGVTWLDIARFDFTTATARKVANLSGLFSKAVAAYTVLASESVLDGVLGERLRAVITTTGTYANTTLSVRASVR